jgi:SAM-dependent methyltransferase
MEPVQYAIMRAAEERHWWYVGLHDLVLRWTRAEAARLGRLPNILDAGCGTGRLAQLLQGVGYVTGCDLHPLALESARQRGVATLWQRDVAADPLGDAGFDVITCMDVLVHRTIRDEAVVLRRFHHALRPGGCLILQVAAFQVLRGAHDAAVHSLRRYRRPHLAALLEGAGFTVEFSSYRLPLFFLPLLLRRAWTRGAVEPGETPGSSDIAASQLPGINVLLTALVKAENFFLTAGAQMPFGTSVIARARKPANA